MLGITRYNTVISQIEKPQQSLKQLNRSLKNVGHALKTLELIRLIFILLLYSSIVTTVFSIIPELEIVVNQILKLSGILGSTVSLIVIGITSKYIGLYTIDLQLIATKIMQKNARSSLRQKKK